MKKKRIVKLEPQTVELFAEVLSKLRPPPPLTVSQWADRYRVLSAESSAEPGRWHTEKAPYQRAIMDAIGDPHVRSVVVMSAAQIGKTDAFILNPLGYYMDYAPCPVMCMQPTLDMGQTLSKDRIAPMIRDTPRLTGLVDTKSRYAGNADTSGANSVGGAAPDGVSGTGTKNKNQTDAEKRAMVKNLFHPKKEG